MATSRFGYKREKGQNAYTGIMSFQHFRGERLYSDIVVTPEGRMTETERVECYPVSADAEENGRLEGYYPDSSVAYIRILWKEFEPERGKYDYGFIEDIISAARAHGQSLIFRLMAHSTRACDDVPEWVKGLVECPERPPMMRVKDSPTDPLFLDLFLEAVRKLGERFDADPVLEAIDISLPGAWGEGHRLDLFPENTLERIVDLYCSVFAHTQLIGQAAKPQLVRRGELVRPVGWRGDGLGHPTLTFERYPAMVEGISDVWMRAPVSFEAYWWLMEWKRRGWDIDRVIEQTLKWHISSFNPKSMPIPYEWKDKIEYWIDRMGYHYVIDAFSAPDRVRAGERAEFKLDIDNVGVAPLYKDHPIKLVFCGEDGEWETVLFDGLRALMPGKRSISAEVPLPRELKAGKYSLWLYVDTEGMPPIWFASDAPSEGVRYRVGQTEIL